MLPQSIYGMPILISNYYLNNLLMINQLFCYLIVNKYFYEKFAL